jgi:hypothetical protein
MRQICISRLIPVLLVGLLPGLPAVHSYGAVALLLEQPYGAFGGMNPTGHAAVYLNHVCAETPTELRMCHEGERGVVVSRYHRVGGYDWIAIPLIPYLYAVDEGQSIPVWVEKEDVAQLRNEYRKEHLRTLAPDVEGSEIPGGDWTQLVGSAYDRTIHGFQVDTTEDQDERLIAVLNDRRNASHFNLFFKNCADFSMMVLNTYYPDSVHRNYIADAGLTTPKQVARSIVKYGKKHPDLMVSSFVIPQVDGTVERSHKVHGVAESLIKSKKYLLPLVILSPYTTGGILLAYLVDGRLDLPKNAAVFDFDEARVKKQPTVVVDAAIGEEEEAPVVVDTAVGEEEKALAVGPVAMLQVSAN